MRVKNELGIERFLIRRRDTRELFDFATTCTSVETFHIALLADLYWAAAVRFEKISMRDEVAHEFPVSTERRDECCKHDDACLDEQLGKLAYPTNVLPAIFCRESQIGAQAMSDVIPVKHKSAIA